VVSPRGTADGREAPASASADFGSEYTANLPELLAGLGLSLAISTYQSGHVIVVRAHGESIDTHFARFDRPMGLAVDAARLVVGTRRELRELRNVPALADRLPGPPRADAVYALRHVQVTGDVDVHEIALAGEETFFVNTLFSCLARRSPTLSFEPVWRPRFVSALAPEDRCHLNGLALVDGRPRYLTALGATDTPQGWRERKRDGGVVIDCLADAVVATGLAMPHSPRWHDGRLWVLESAKGALSIVDPGDGRVTEVARLPGFARGLALAGRYAFVGLSMLREANAFTDIPITDDGRARICGIYAVDLRSGRPVAFLRFSGRVEELFAVEAIVGARWPALVADDPALLDSTYAIPDAALAEVPVPAGTGR
jgi:uncharacterized protein (TIGR03032 family)